MPKIWIAGKAVELLPLNSTNKAENTLSRIEKRVGEQRGMTFSASGFGWSV
jgi:hypothetical protein